MWFEALLGIPIGGEMKAATIAASKVNANIMLIDRTQSATRTYFTDRTVEQSCAARARSIGFNVLCVRV